MASRRSSGGASLDGDPPASAWPRPSVSIAWDRSPGRRPGRDPARSWRSLDRGSSALGLSAAVFSTAHRARSVASGALCRGSPRPNLIGRARRPSLSVESARLAARFRLHRRLVKSSRFAGARTPSVDECLSPAPACAGHGFRRGPFCPAHACARAGPKGAGSSKPVTVPTASPPRAGFRRPFTVRAQSWMARPERFERLDQTPLVDFCNQFQSTSTTTRPLDPRHVLVDVARPAYAGLGGNPPGGVKPHPPHRPPPPGRPSFALVRALRLSGRASTGHRPRFHGSGASRLSPSGASVSTLVNESRRRSFAPTRSARTPLVAKPREHRLEIPMLNNAAQPKPNQAPPTISPRKPCYPRMNANSGGPTWPLHGPLSRGRQPNGTPRRSTCADRARPSCTDESGLLAQPNFTRGPGPPHPTLREEIRDPLHPRCLPSMSHLPATQGFRPVRHSGRALSTGCYQPVDNTRRLSWPRSRSGGLDEPPAAWARSPLLLESGRTRPASTGPGTLAQQPHQQHPSKLEMCRRRHKRPHRLLRSKRSAA